MKHKLVVYTAIIGGNYDNLLQPLVTDLDVKYVCYVKKGSKTESMNGVWEIREMTYENKDNTRVARYAKMHPHILFPDYDYSLWIDGNIQIVDKELFSIIDGKIDDNIKISSMSHPHVNCCYDDAMICIAAKKDKTWRILEQMVYLKMHGFPKNYGMYETNVFFRNHTSEKIIQFNEQWWYLLSHMSRRDQLGCTYSMWKQGLPMDYLLPIGKNARNCEVVKYYPHKSKNNNTQSQSKIKRFLYEIIKKLTGYRKNS